MRLLQLRNRHFLFFDVLVALGLPALALTLLTASLTAPAHYTTSLVGVTFVFLVIEVVVFYAVGLYRRFWKYASVEEIGQILVAVAASVAIQSLLFFGVLRPVGFFAVNVLPATLPLIYGLLLLIVTGGSRYTVRLSQWLRHQGHNDREARRVLVFGAGEAGMRIVEEMRRKPGLRLYPVAFMDDAPEKMGKRIRGIDVLGSRENIADVVHTVKPQLIIIAISRASSEALRDIALLCQKTGVETKIIPSVYELLDAPLSIGRLRDLDVEDLLRRPLVTSNAAQVEALLQQTSILVTGAGGSIGSELCRQIMHLRPSKLILLGHGENSIFEIEAELRLQQSEGHSDAPVQLQSVIADIRDRARMEQVFAEVRPDIVFHTAAHKHVPLMEHNVADAVTNNVEGTRIVLECCKAFGIERFVFISTDKAVAPTSMLGATKYVAELLVREAALQTGRAYTAVRFGNVLGSRGSMLHIFRKQIAQGGPLTVTHPEVRRYFMTVSEAVHLVLQAAAMSEGGEVFVLDMGEPLRIVDLARDLILLSGLREGQDIELIFTGLRPGEKLNEQLFGDDEHATTTPHEKIFVCQHKASATWTSGQADLTQSCEALVEMARQGDVRQIVDMMEELVPGYTPGDMLRATATSSTTATFASD